MPFFLCRITQRNYGHSFLKADDEMRINPSFDVTELRLAENHGMFAGKPKHSVYTGWVLR